jgi:CubicO group peptidase (beta-lactamase class C family)
MDRIYWPTVQWTASSPEEQGMCSAQLAKLVAFGKSVDLDSHLVIRRGRIVTEAYYSPYKAGVKHTLNSATKSVVGIMIGIAVQRGLLDTVDHPVSDIFSDRKIANISEEKRAITIKSLLDMTSGLNWTEPLTGIPKTASQMARSPDRVQFILDRPMSSRPRAIFNYNSGNTHLLSAILTKKTGRSAFEFAKEQLFYPLGVSDVRWESDRQGNSLGGRGLYLQPRDMAKIGYLCLHNGEWDGKQILPSTWIDEVKNASVNMHFIKGTDFHYANLFWTLPDKNAYMAVGFNSQIILVLPALDIVAVTTGRAPPRFLKLIDGIITSVKSDQPLPADSAAFFALKDSIKDAAKRTFWCRMGF